MLEFKLGLHILIFQPHSSWNHILGSADKFYFDKEIRVNSGLIGSYDEDLQLRTQGTTRLTLSNSTGDATFNGSNISIGGQNNNGSSTLILNTTVWGEPHIQFYPYSNYCYYIGNYGTSAPKQFMLKTNNGSVVFETGGSNSADVWFGGGVSAASFTDRTPYPETLQIAYDVLSSHKKLSDYDVDNKEHQLDHTKLHDFAKPQITVSSGTPDNEVITKELGQDGRDASAVISCLVEVVNDLISKVTVLENA
jgi:hypothetical protein